MHVDRTYTDLLLLILVIILSSQGRNRLEADQIQCLEKVTPAFKTVKSCSEAISFQLSHCGGFTHDVCNVQLFCKLFYKLCVTIRFYLTFSVRILTAQHMRHGLQTVMRQELMVQMHLFNKLCKLTVLSVTELTNMLIDSRKEG